jgi:hypothetical protein
MMLQRVKECPLVAYHSYQVPSNSTIASSITGMQKHRHDTRPGQTANFLRLCDLASYKAENYIPFLVNALRWIEIDTSSATAQLGSAQHNRLRPYDEYVLKLSLPSQNYEGDSINKVTRPLTCVMFLISFKFPARSEHVGHRFLSRTLDRASYQSYRRNISCKMAGLAETWSNIEVRSVIRCLRLEGTSPAEIHRQLPWTGAGWF